MVYPMTIEHIYLTEWSILRNSHSNRNIVDVHCETITKSKEKINGISWILDRELVNILLSQYKFRGTVVEMYFRSSIAETNICIMIVNVNIIA